MTTSTMGPEYYLFKGEVSPSLGKASTYELSNIMLTNILYLHIFEARELTHTFVVINRISPAFAEVK